MNSFDRSLKQYIPCEHDVHCTTVERVKPREAIAQFHCSSPTAQNVIRLWTLRSTQVLRYI